MTIKAGDLFRVEVSKTTVLDGDEIVTEILIPKPPKEAKNAFVKSALRKTIDFHIVNWGAMISSSERKVSAARICLNAVYVKPYRATMAEEVIVGKTIDEANAEAAGSAAVSEASPWVSQT